MRNIHKTGSFLTAMMLTIAALAGTPSKKDEGMYPLALLSSLDLKAAGMKISAEELYNPNGVSLVDALVRIGGCTGSFISGEGMIITNHHCVFGSVAAVSTAEKNYLAKGFYAASRDQEIKTGMKVRITQSYSDVSDLVLDSIYDAMSPAERAERIRRNIAAVEKEEKEKNPGLEIEVSEMFVGKFYTLFRYKTLNDIRLVYVPPRSIGEFGGESDNWVWPRHNADFSIVRAYEDGKPFVPKKFLPIDRDGVKENDFAFILGYPGRTYRHQPAQYLKVQYDHVLPFISDWFDFKIAVWEDAGKADVNTALSYASMIKGHANTTKNFKGKIQGLSRTSILQDKFDEQEKLRNFAAADATLNKKYTGFFEELDALYKEEYARSRKEMILSQMFRSSGLMYAGAAFSEWSAEINARPKKERDAYLASKTEDWNKRFEAGYVFQTAVIDRKFTQKLLEYLLDLNDAEINAILNKHGLHSRTALVQVLDQWYKKSNYARGAKLKERFKGKMKQTILAKDVTKPFAAALYQYYRKLAFEAQERSNKINALLPKLADLKQAYYKNTFIPDANSTLRFTYGYVKGYWPDDAVYHQPFTTLRGIFEKAKDDGDYYLEKEYLETYRSVQASDNLRIKPGGDVVVAMLYNMDTTGGNSGSPILNANGELIGVNFDRAFTATINDFAWNESYSRSIGVDMRFVIYVLKHIGKADSVLEELNIDA